MGLRPRASALEAVVRRPEGRVGTVSLCSSYAASFWQSAL